MNKKKILIFIMLISLILGIFELKSNYRFGGIIRDLIFYKATYINSDSLNVYLEKEAKEENDELKKLLEIDYSLTDFNVINASIIERNISSWLNEFTINKGLLDGIEEDQVVVANDGVIGRIISTSYKTSKVKLITSDKNYVSVAVNNCNKLLNGDKNELVIKGINKSDDIKVGDVVLTSGLSNIYPKGLIIGTVDEIKSDGTYTGYIAKIKISTDINNIRFVAVLKRREI